MRLIVIGSEYAGKTALIDGLMEWGDSIGIHHHLDDHFSIPDRQFLSLEDARAMLAMPPVIKERFQRFQIYYHVHVLEQYADCLLGGFHIEEAIYGRRYYYPQNVWPSYTRSLEQSFPEDTILLLLKAAPGVIRRRMQETPHQYPIVPAEDVEAVGREFEDEYRRSGLKRKFVIDTSETTPQQLLTRFRERVVPHLDTRDLLRWQMLGAR
ncbi:MAG TPA: hypothetical protein VGL23_03635 [Chloroflexota bacterium]